MSIDVELVEPLTLIAETFLKRPGKVSLNSIKKLSESYGFTTFVDDGADTDCERLSVSGQILLIDIDFRKSMVVDVSVSSAVNVEKIDGVNWDFLFGIGDQGKGVGEILLANLQETTLDAFNMNLRVLIQFDRLSGFQPNDLFTLFAELAWGITQQNTLELGNLDGTDSVQGLGKLLVNIDGKVGVFLEYWRDDRYVNDWLRREKGLNIKDTVYRIHFKVQENLEEEEVENEGQEKTEEVNNGRLFDTQTRKWKKMGNNKNGNKGVVTLELCPYILIPADVADGCSSCWVEMTDEKEKWMDNRDISKCNDASTEYSAGVEYLVGCRMVKVWKLQIDDLNRLGAIIGVLRSWCKVQSIARKQAAQVTSNDHDASNRDEANIDLDEILNSNITEADETPNDEMTISGGTRPEIRLGDRIITIENGCVVGDTKVEISESMS